jgi:hypothetical protein
MPSDIFDELRRSKSIFRIEKPKSQFDGAICPALLAPDVLQSVSSTGLEHVSGGCWPEDQKAPVNISRDSFRPGRQRPHRLGWHCSRCSNYGQEEYTGISNVMVAACDDDLVWRNCVCARTFRSSTPCSPATNIYAFAKPYTPCCDLKHDQKRLEQSSATDRRTSTGDNPKRGSRTQDTPNVVWMSGRQKGLRESDMCSNTELALHERSAERLSTNASTDALSVTASSAILSPAMMPKVARVGAIADEGSNCDSMDSDSGFSVEADEMIDMQSQAWKHLFRGVWHRARSIRGLKGLKMGNSLRYSSIG